MEAITGLLEGFDFTKLLPKIGQLMSSVRFWTVLLMYVGPLVLLGFGLWYYLKPVSSPSRKTGFRTYFGMGSIEAWLFTQKLAGMVWTGLGGVMTLISVIVSLSGRGEDTMSIVSGAVVWMIWQVVLTLLSYAAIYLIVFFNFDKEGNSRRK